MRAEVAKRVAGEALAEIGYSILDAFQSQRYNIAIVEKAGMKGLFKSPIHPSASPRLENEAILYQRQLGKLGRTQMIYIPDLLESGEINGLPWLIRPYFEKALVDPSAVTKINLNPVEVQAITSFLFLLQEFRFQLPNDTTIPLITGEAFQFYGAQNGLEFKKSIIAITRKYGSSIGLKNLEEVIGLISLAKFTERSFNHEDYKLWHFYRDEERLALIDGEYSNNLTPLHRDFSILFTSTFTNCEHPDLALEFLRNYSNQISEPEEFLRDFVAMTAWITASELRDAVQASAVTKYHYQLLSLLISGEIRNYAR